MSANSTAVRAATPAMSDFKPLAVPSDRKAAMATILPKLQEAKKAHMAAWAASQAANEAYKALRDEYSRICGLK
jgi:hypothetical protein